MAVSQQYFAEKLGFLVLAQMSASLTVVTETLYYLHIRFQLQL